MTRMKTHIKNQIISTSWASSSLVCLLLFTFSNNTHAITFQEYEKKIKNAYSLRNAVEKLPRKDIENQLREFIASGRPGRLAGSPGHKKSQEYLEGKLRSFNSAGVTVSKMEFAGVGGADKAISGVNFIWEKKGVTSPDEILLITAHYDSLIRDSKTQKPVLKGEMPGADNNATGVSVMLSMIEILNQLEIPKTVKFVFLDLEEFNSQGSKYFANSEEFKAEKESKKIAGVMNLIMIGHDTRTRDTEKKLNNMKAYSTDDAFVKPLIEAADKNYSTIKFTLNPPQNNERFIDSTAAFKAQGIPSVTFTQNRESDLNPRLWSSNDFFETLNINTYTNVFKALASSVLAWNYGVVK